MLTKKVICHSQSDSPYNVPLLVVPKKSDSSGNKKWRIVIDLKKLDEETDHDVYPLPIIDDIPANDGHRVKGTDWKNMLCLSG